MRGADQEQYVAAGGRGGGSHLVGVAASLGALPLRGYAAAGAGAGAGRTCWHCSGSRPGRGRNEPSCTSGRRKHGRGSTGTAAPYSSADYGSGGPSVRCESWSGRSRAGRTRSRAGARISTGTRGAYGPHRAMHTPTAPGRSSGGCATRTEAGCGLRSGADGWRGRRRNA